MLGYGNGLSGRIYRNVQPMPKEEQKPVRTRQRETVIVTDLKTGMEQEFLTISAAAEYLKCSRDTVSRQCSGKAKKPYDDRYKIEKRSES